MEVAMSCQLTSTHFHSLPLASCRGRGHSYWTWWIIRSAIPKPPSGYFSSVSSHLIME
jgi:hypothetical protein